RRLLRPLADEALFPLLALFRLALRSTGHVGLDPARRTRSLLLRPQPRQLRFQLRDPSAQTLDLPAQPLVHGHQAVDRLQQGVAARHPLRHSSTITDPPLPCKPASSSLNSYGRRMVERCVDTFGKIDAVVHVAGILRDRMIFNVTEGEWDAVIAVHLKGAFNVIQPASQRFREQRSGRIIAMSSTSALGAPGQPNYGAAKAGILGLIWSCANVLVPQ